MTIHDELTTELRAAMRARDRARIDVIRQVETEVSVAKSAPGFSGPVDDALYRKTIAAYVKKMEKSRREYETMGERGRPQADKLAFEVEYLSRWLPQTAGDDETRRLVRAAIAELGVSDPAMVGRVIGQVMASGGALDGRLVNRIAREELGA